MKQLNSLLIQLEEAMEEGWTAYENGETPSDETYLILDELVELGIGKVLVPTQNGRLAWLNVETRQFE